MVYAENQPEYSPLPVFRTPDGRVISAWRPTPKELELLNNGEAIYLTLHTFNTPLQPIMMTVGEPSLLRHCVLCGAEIPYDNHIAACGRCIAERQS